MKVVRVDLGLWYYDININYHPNRASVIVDALSRKPHSSLSSINTRFLEELENIGVKIVMSQRGETLASL
jgi:hypothetical protein